MYELSGIFDRDLFLRKSATIFFLYDADILHPVCIMWTVIPSGKFGLTASTLTTVATKLVLCDLIWGILPDVVSMQRGSLGEVGQARQAPLRMQM